MTTTTYEDYLEYIKDEFSKISPNDFSDEEKAYYEVVKKDLENSKSLPSRILKSPVLYDEHLNNEATKNIKYIQSEAGGRGKLKSIKELFTIHGKHQRTQRFSLALNFALVVISMVASYFLITSYPVKIHINTPVMSWQASDSPPISIPTDEPNLPLTGAAGSEDQNNGENESYTLQIGWHESILDITFIIWGIIPILTLLVMLYIPILRWARVR